MASKLRFHAAPGTAAPVGLQQGQGLRSGLALPQPRKGVSLAPQRDASSRAAGTRSLPRQPRVTASSSSKRTGTQAAQRRSAMDFAEGAAHPQRTVREAVEDLREAVGNASLGTLGTVAAAAGGVALFAVMSSSFLASLHRVPLLPEAMQTVGLIYCACVVRELLTKERLQLAPSPLSSLSARGAHLPAAEILAYLPEGTADPKVVRKLQQLAEERDNALVQLETMRRREGGPGRAMAEKEALETVAVRLSDERDSALSEVAALRAVVNAMTGRMKAIETMLAQEVQRLQEQNVALETVALQLADERDRAVGQVALAQGALEAQRREDKKVLEVLAAQLIQERNAALQDAEELKLTVASLMEANGSDSGLPASMEQFIKSRVRAVRAQFVDISKPYSAQVAEVDAFAEHLAEEYGAPREWTRGYIAQFLGGSAGGRTLGVGGVKPAQNKARKMAS